MIDKNKVQEVLDKIRPVLQADGGDVMLERIDQKKGLVEVRLVGICTHCPMAQITLKDLIEKGLKEKIKGIKKVIPHPESMENDEQNKILL